MGSKNLMDKQVATIEIAKRTGKIIAGDYPEIADKYKSGDTLEKIASEYSIAEEYGIKKSSALTIVYFALRELVSEEDLRNLGKIHLSWSGSKRIEIGRRGGEVGGKKLYGQGRGIFAFSHEQLARYGRKGSEKGVPARGFTIYSDEEKGYLFELCQNSEYQYKSGLHKGRPIYTKISAEIETKFGIKRSLNSLYKMYYLINLKSRPTQPF